MFGPVEVRSDVEGALLGWLELPIPLEKCRPGQRIAYLVRRPRRRYRPDHLRDLLVNIDLAWWRERSGVERLVARVTLVEYAALRDVDVFAALDALIGDDLPF